VSGLVATFVARPGVAAKLIPLPPEEYIVPDKASPERPSTQASDFPPPDGLEQGRRLGAYATSVDLLEQLSRSSCGYAVKKHYSLAQTIREIEAQAKPAQEEALARYLKSAEFQQELKRIRAKNQQFISGFIDNAKSGGLDDKTTCGMVLGSALSSFQAASQDWQEVMKHVKAETASKSTSRTPAVSYDCTVAPLSDGLEYGSGREPTAQRELRLRVHNNTTSALGAFAVQVVIFDCPNQRFVRDECVQLGSTTTHFHNNPKMHWTGHYVEVPPRQARDVRDRLRFDNELLIRGYEFYNCTMQLET
jgi:hypothetical protein